MVLEFTWPRPTIAGLLPPNSRVSGTRLSLAAFMTLRPTGVLPVNNRWSKGSALNSAPTSGPPKITATSSIEKFAASMREITSLVRGVSSEGLSIARLPAAIAVARGISVREIG
ncbi:Uncharacterised protein [Acinetobacter baumannii]|nr:Uncharacterised protein [Acinetobacter baumannii]